jgi:hypothetical protein
MSRDSVLRLGRRAAEAGMVDACVIRRRTGETVGADAVVTPTWATLYTGKCRVQIRAEAGQGEEVGEAYRVIERREVQLPITAAGLAEGDRIEITASAHDPELVGKVYAVRDVPAKSEATARRVGVIEVTS